MTPTWTAIPLDELKGRPHPFPWSHPGHVWAMTWRARKAIDHLGNDSERQAAAVELAEGSRAGIYCVRCGLPYSDAAWLATVPHGWLTACPWRAEHVERLAARGDVQEEGGWMDPSVLARITEQDRSLLRRCMREMMLKSYGALDRIPILRMEGSKAVLMVPEAST